MHVFTFKPRFAPLVEAGTKNQTIRPFRHRRPKAGDEASMREWTGRPRHSAQRTLRETVKLTSVRPIMLGIQVTIDGVPLDAGEKDLLAVADGFASWKEMQAWFREEHGLPFHGDLIQWPRPTPP